MSTEDLMKYFTPELLVQNNSSDEAVAEAAIVEWKRRNRNYLRRYKKIQSLLPESVRKFTKEQCLHDADWAGCAQLSTYTFPWNWHDVIIIARQEHTLIPEYKNTLAILQYLVTRPADLQTPVQPWPLSHGRPTWLYDDIDLVEPGVFSHSILVSNGLVATIQFREVRYHIAPLLTPARTGAAEEGRPAARRKSASA
jgi:hypothetical protein